MRKMFGDVKGKVEGREKGKGTRAKNQ